MAAKPGRIPRHLAAEVIREAVAVVLEEAVVRREVVAVRLEVVAEGVRLDPVVEGSIALS